MNDAVCNGIITWISEEDYLCIFSQGACPNDQLCVNESLHTLLHNYLNHNTWMDERSCHGAQYPCSGSHCMLKLVATMIAIGITRLLTHNWSTTGLLGSHSC